MDQQNQNLIAINYTGNPSVVTGTLSEFALETFGVTLDYDGLNATSKQNEKKPILPRGLMLGIEKFRRPKKHYRLIWFGHHAACFARENETEFRRKSDAVEAGEKISKETGAPLFAS